MKTVSSDNLARFKENCDATYAKVGDGITNAEVIEYVEELPTASETSPNFVQTPDGTLYRKKAVEGGSGGASVSYEYVAMQEVPTPTTADNGKVLGVTNGAYALQEASGGGGGGGMTGYTYWGSLQQTSVVESVVSDVSGNQYNVLPAIIFSSEELNNDTDLQTLLTNGGLLFLCRYSEVGGNGAIKQVTPSAIRVSNGQVTAAAFIYNQTTSAWMAINFVYNISGITG